MSTLILAVELETPKVTVPSALSILDWHHWNLAWELCGKVCRVRPFPCGAWAIGTPYRAKLFLALGSTYGSTAIGTEEIHLRCTLLLHLRRERWSGPWKEGAVFLFSKIEITTGSTSPHRISPYHLACLPNVYGGSEHLGSTADAAAVTSRQSYQG
ncbi:hypothetical protein JMJ77_0001778 [Colletotrichum scovillei]|uniref:Uncharacterized protein n=1 Tax=Colletotrichum scovillei TaxID=1209932 RepID=A0A9P7UFY9_9PEZI|nr:hypothetical protein JMJ77_0001778 [Colletotrichum scovillei]KAG7070187.1 hypothetical protein JMJ76_0001443 [Colletotrichum scovillei]KAG7078438.1 hypothetical protein JMJ78_0002109 [Colletotrichum scovillei]